MKELQVMCIGAGYFSKFHVEAWSRIEGVKIAAICDQNFEKAKALAEEFGIKNIYSSTEEAYENESFDFVDIITPPDTHHQLCQEAISFGKHIICQKPLAPTFEEAQELTTLLKGSPVRFMVHENFRFQPWHRKIKELLNQKIIGDQIFSLYHRMRMGDGWQDDAYLGRQPYFRQMPRLLIHETGIHFIDVFRYLLGEISSVYARLRKLNPHIKGEDCGVVLFESEQGTQVIFDGNRYNEPGNEDPRYTFGEMTIEGNKGSLRLLHDGSILVNKLGQPEEKIDYTHDNKNFAGDCVYSTQKHFVECLKSGEEFESNIHNYYKNVQIQEAIYQSSQEKREVDTKCIASS